jgi:PAS domain S-box-containing protein
VTIKTSIETRAAAPDSIVGPFSHDDPAAYSEGHGASHSDHSDHFVQFYEDDAFLQRAVGNYLGASLGVGGRALVIATREHLAGIEQQLDYQGIDVARVKARGQLLTFDAANTLAMFMSGGEPDSILFERVLGSVVRQATEGGRRLHAFGEMVALLLADGKGEAAIRLEELWNELAQRYSFSLFCAYPLEAFGNAESVPLFDHICREHSRVLPAETYRADDQDSDGQFRSIAMLQQKARALESEVSERKRAEQALVERSRTLQILQRVSSTLVAERDLEKVVQTVTDAGCELSGAAFGAFFYDVERASGESHTLYTLSGIPPDVVSADSVSRATEGFGPTFDRVAAVRLADAAQAPRYRKGAPFFGLPPGTLPVRSYLAVPVISTTGMVLGGLFFGSPLPDVFTEESEQLIMTLAAQAAVAIDNTNLQTALRREVEALRVADEGSRRLASIVETSDDAIISKSLDGTIRTWNEGATRIFGYTEEEAIGQSVTMLFPPGHLDEEPAIISRICRGERVDHYETKRRRKDGSLVDISLTVSPIIDKNGKIVGASKIARDISQRKRDEEAVRRATEELARSRDELELRVEQRTASLREAIAQMEEFSYTVSHDLRAPLRAMNVHCRALLEDHANLLAGSPEAIESLHRIAENCSRLDKMVRDVLAYGRVARDQLNLEHVCLDKLVRETISHYPNLQPPLAEIRVEPLDDVIGHEPSLVQVVSNLLNNAVKFVEPGTVPSVCVRTEREDGKVRLWVEDNGIGIDPQYHHRLFAMFERIHPKMAYEGTGVGLAIVRKATERMGGRVGVVSDGRNGSRFWVELREAPACV